MALRNPSRRASLKLIALGLFLVGGQAFGLVVGDKIPSTTLMTATGKKYQITSYAKSQKKKNLLLVFFRTGTCGVCVSQLAEFSREIQQIHDANSAIMAVSLDDAIVQKEVSGKINNKYPILLDPDARIVKEFGVYNPAEKLAFPSLFVVGPDSRILWNYVGRSGSDRPPLQKVLEVLRHYSGLLPKRQVSGTAPK